MLRIDLDLGGAGAVVDEEHALAGGAAVGGLVEAALVVGAVGMATAATKTMLGLVGSTAIWPICWPSRRPRWVQVLPASVDL